MANSPAVGGTDRGAVPNPELGLDGAALSGRDGSLVPTAAGVPVDGVWPAGVDILGASDM